MQPSMSGTRRDRPWLQFSMLIPDLLSDSTEYNHEERNSLLKLDDHCSTAGQGGIVDLRRTEYVRARGVTVPYQL